MTTVTVCYQILLSGSAICNKIISYLSKSAKIFNAPWKTTHTIRELCPHIKVENKHI